ncbi:hypothetical protein [Pyrococcus yayanosii]|uniref:Uncharacterized protein n=1 Tax=Pyrococcus yayanosii (strain CH1 / JCM 16557) TaxID=529709 RepID=F8AHR9_PYRYC|nr:hypothetical protein [Pyrococcus yayanosii]AEH24202.1 hypothetical protein PYCH_05120 [Pyrococcus yayanosii CH1]
MFLESLREFLRGFFQSFKDQSTEYIEFELRELENVFALLLMGSFIGIPSPPTTLTLRLLPHMAREFIVMQRRAENLDDVFAELAGLFEVT